MRRDEDPNVVSGVPETPDKPGVSRRDFLKIGGITVASAPLLQAQVVKTAGGEVKVWGPGKAPVALTVNGKQLTAQLEPRVTLLDALRQEFDVTGAKRVCDRATCGACTVLLDGHPVYACSILAIDAQGHDITTVEGLMEEGKLNPVQQAFIDNDASQCGFCTPGFIVAASYFTARHPQVTPQSITQHLSGNLCRCGTYAGIREAVKQAAGKTRLKGGRHA